MAIDHDNESASSTTMADANYADADHVPVGRDVDHVGGTINKYVCIYLVFASIASIASVIATVLLVVFVCFAHHQYFINNNNVDLFSTVATSSIRITTTMTSFPPSATVTPQQQQLQPERDPTMAMSMKIVTRK